MVFAVAPGDRRGSLAIDVLFGVGAGIVAAEGNGRGVVMKLVQADLELAHHMGHNVHDQARIQCLEDAVQTTSHAIVVEMFEILGRKSKQLWRKVSRPLGDTIHGLTRNQ